MRDEPTVGAPAALRVMLSEQVVTPVGGSLTFGRQADLVVDEANRFLHRVVGRFVARDDLWWLQHHGRRGVLVVETMGAASRLEIGPGGQFPVPGGSFVVAFSAGKANYELECWSEAGEGPGAAWTGDAADGEGTLEFGRVPLTAEQHLLCVALCVERLGGGAGLPSNLDTAARLGWSITKFNRKLDYVCAKFARAGVHGLRGDRGELAQDRRRALVDHVLVQQLVTAEDLGLLGDPGRQLAG